MSWCLEKSWRKLLYEQLIDLLCVIYIVCGFIPSQVPSFYTKVELNTLSYMFNIRTKKKIGPAIWDLGGRDRRQSYLIERQLWTFIHRLRNDSTEGIHSMKQFFDASPKSSFPLLKGNSNSGNALIKIWVTSDNGRW